MSENNDSANIIVFTLHKSASMFLYEQSRVLCDASGITLHSPNNPGSDLDARRLLLDETIWRTRHGCFAPVRFYVDVKNLHDFQVILHLRDPRDVLVSMYYSYCYIHVGELPGNTGYRKEVAERGIDEFVLNKASPTSNRLRGDYGTGSHVEDIIGNLKKRYEDYINYLLRRSNVTLVKYEEMVTDYASWLRKFSGPFPLKSRESVIEGLIESSANFFPKRGQDEMTHIRHVTPGDYKEKLKPSTISQLNVAFAGILDNLGYER